jgi:predicted P-loop ATPase
MDDSKGKPNLRLVKSEGEDQTGRTEADADLQQRLLEWTDKVLADVGYTAKLAAATSLEELAAVTFDRDDVAVVAAIHEALKREFKGFTAARLTRVLEARFNSDKRARYRTLLGGEDTSSSGAAPPHWTADLKFTKSGDVLSNTHNMTLMFQNHPDWDGVLAYDEFNFDIVLKRDPPFQRKSQLKPQWTDVHTTEARNWFIAKGMSYPRRTDVIETVMLIAKDNAFHPVVDCLEALRWDGVPRIARWLTTYAGVEDSEYVRVVGEKWLIAGVARILMHKDGIKEEGVKADNVLVLEGKQRKLKSTLLRALTLKDEWFTDQLSKLSTKDASLEVAGVMIVEMPELDAALKSSKAATKRFLSQQDDRVRPPYGRRVEKHPRQCIFAGTVNPSPRGYWRDETGAGRFWFVATGTIDIEAMRRDKEQLWAEAVHQFKTGTTWWLTQDQEERLARPEQDKRYRKHEWEVPIREFVWNKTEVTYADVFKMLRVEETNTGLKTLADILIDRLGFRHSRPRNAKSGRYTSYIRDITLAHERKEAPQPEPPRRRRKSPRHTSKRRR